MIQPLELMVTLWPSFPHFPRFVKDRRLSGIRLNSAMMSRVELEEELRVIQRVKPEVPLYFDVKGRQLRIAEVHLNPDYLDVSLNHPISVETPAVVIFKAGADSCLLKEVTDGGRRLIFDGGPRWAVRPGESIHIRHPSLKVHGPLFSQEELGKIEEVKRFGFQRYFLSYVEGQSDVDTFLELVGHDAEVMLKIENKKGLDFVASDFKKKDNLRLVAARGDLYVEVDKPHQIIDAMRLIIRKDPEACVGSRILLSVCHEPVPACADFLELAWLCDIGYHNMMLCDEICLKEELLATAVNAFEAFRQNYRKPKLPGRFNRFRRFFTPSAQ